MLWSRQAESVIFTETEVNHSHIQKNTAPLMLGRFFKLMLASTIIRSHKQYQNILQLTKSYQSLKNPQYI